MPMMKNVLGLDLGSHTLKAVELRQTLRGLEPVQLRIHPRADVEAPIAESLHRFLRMHQLSTEHVTCALPGDRISTRRLEFPFRDRKRLGQAVPFEVEAQIPFDIEDVVVDWELLEGERNHGVVAATIAQRRDVADFLESLAEAGCRPRILEAEGLVLGNLASLFELGGTRLLVDLGHRKTTLCLMVDEHPIAARTIPVGGLALTRAIAQERGVELEQAEQSKCQEGIFHTDFNSVSRGALDALERVARGIIHNLESLEHILGGPAVETVQELTLLGGGARLHRIDEYLTDRVGIEAKLLSLPEDPEGAALVAGGDPVLFGPAIALALRNTARARTRMNFRKDQFAYRTDLASFFTPEMRPTAIMAAICVGLMVIGGLSSSFLESKRADRLEAQAMALYESVFPDRPAGGSAVAAMSQAVSEARDRADFLGLYSGNLSALDLMTELSMRVPADLDVRFEEVNIDRKVIRIRAAANDYESTDRVVNLLKQEAPFSGAAVSGSIKTEKNGSVTFNINIPLETQGDEA
jgi:general secretion pathway protein L